MIVVPDVIHDQPRFFPGTEHLAPGTRDLVHRYVVDEGRIQELVAGLVNPLFPVLCRIKESRSTTAIIIIINSASVTT